MNNYLYPSHIDMVKDEDLTFAGRSIRESIDIIKELYLSDNRSWIIGFSGGKDSTVILSLVYFALSVIPKKQLTKPVYVVCSDTLVETPVVVNLIKNVLKNVAEHAKKTGLPIYTQMVVPKNNDTFWVSLLGKGYPAPTRSFRWCTERMKISPVSDFIEDKVSKYGEVIVVLGSRKQESSSRAQSIEKHSIEGSHLARHSSLPNAFTYMPIEDWSADEVWEYLLSAPSPWGASNKELFDMYKGSNQGECPLVIDKNTPSCGNSRFGCWTCTVVTEDKALHGLIESGMEWMRPFLDFRNMLYQTTLPENKNEYRNHKRRSGRIDLSRNLNEDGSFKHVPGPYWMKYRQQWVRELLEMQKKLEEEGHDHVAITDDELIEIRKEWIADPNEPDWADTMPKIIQEIYPEKLRLFPLRDVGAFGEGELEVISDVADEYNLSPTLIKKVIDLEIAVSGLGSRRGIRSKLESLLKQDWDTLEDAMANNIDSHSSTDLYSQKREELEQMLKRLNS
jgi:DNA sulfur modification protein DndC